MNIALIGYGRMGKEIELLAPGMAHTIKLIIDIDNQKDLTPENFTNIDVAIEFTTPEAAIKNILFCMHNGIPMVTGTTGWTERLNEIEKVCSEKDGSLVYSSNFSPGVNIMFAINEYMAGLMNNFPGYSVKLTEVHHTRKLDAPSGTAISLAEQIIRHNKVYKNWSLLPAEVKDAVQIEAIREDEVKGIHEVIYESDIDVISLKHNARSRKGMAEGALMAARFIVNHKGLYTMRDVLGF